MEYENIINQQLEAMDLEQLEELAGVGRNIGLPGLSPAEIVGKLFRGEVLLEPESLLAALSRLFFSEVQDCLVFAVEIIAICIIMGLLKNLNSGFGEQTASQVAALACSCAVIALSLTNFLTVYTLCQNTLNLMATSMQVLLPILTPLLLSMGSVTAGGVLNPIIVAAVTLFTTVIQKVILPALFLSCILFLGNSLTGRDYVKKLAAFLRGFALFAMGLALTIFSGVSALQGLVTKTADGMLLKAARFSIDNFIPVVGGFAADSVDMILSCTSIIKNGIGIFGLLLIAGAMALPLLKLLAAAVIYKLVAILAEPMGNAEISDCMNQVGNTVITLAAILFLAGLLFLIFLAVLISIKTVQ